MSAVEAKRRALHGAEHRSSIDRVMAGASAVVPIVVRSHAHYVDMVFSTSMLDTGGNMRS